MAAMNGLRIVGLHPVEAPEPVHLVELDASGYKSDLDWGAITQPVEGRDRSYWQVPYDEMPVPGKPDHWCFFFHYLDRSRPLSSPAGALVLPTETPLPAHLRCIKYEQP